MECAAMGGSPDMDARGGSRLLEMERHHGRYQQELQHA